MRRIGLVLIWISGQVLATQLAPVVSTYHFTSTASHQGYNIYIIKPCVWHNGIPGGTQIRWATPFQLPADAQGNAWEGINIGEGPLPLDKQLAIYEANRNGALELLGHLHQALIAEYRRRKTIPTEGEIPSAILNELEPLRRGELGVVAITKERDPTVIHQMVAIGYDGPHGLTLEKRLVGRGLDRKLNRPAIRLEDIPDNEFLDSGQTAKPTQPGRTIESIPGKPGHRTYAAGAVAELKHFVRFRRCPEDFRPLTQQLFITHLARFSPYSTLPAEFHSDELMRNPITLRGIGYEFQLELRQYHRLGVLPYIFMHEYLLAPTMARQLRITDLVLEAIDDPDRHFPLTELYRKGYQFDTLQTIDPDPDFPTHVTNIMHTPATRFEFDTKVELMELPGGKLMIDGNIKHSVHQMIPGDDIYFVEAMPHDRFEARQYLEWALKTPDGRIGVERANRDPLPECPAYIADLVFGYPAKPNPFFQFRKQ